MMLGSLVIHGNAVENGAFISGETPGRSMRPFICERIESAAQRFPDRIALQIHRGATSTSYTYRQTAEFANNLCRSLKLRGLEKGDRVAIWSPTGPEWAIACLGILCSGAVVVPLDVEYGPEQVVPILVETGCKLIFTVGDKVASLQKLATRLPAAPIIVSLDPCDELNEFYFVDSLLGDGDMLSPQLIDPGDVAAIVYTSGTTGQPRGVVVPHRSIAATTLGMLKYLDITPDDNVLAVVPSHHVFAFIASLLVPLSAGATITYLQTVKSTELLKTVQDAGITIFPCVPQVFYALHKRILTEVGRRPLVVRGLFRLLQSLCTGLRRWGVNPGRAFFPAIHKMLGGRLRLLLSGGSYFDPDVVRDFYSLGFTVQQGYGLTESFGGGTITPASYTALGSVGVALPGVEVKIVEPDASGMGEIAIAGLSVMHGYLNDPAPTDDVLRDGWLSTGDLGYVDGDGNLHVTGRKKELIVLSSGKKLLPEEIEAHYLKSPCLKEMCVMGFSGASDYAGAEKLHAIVVPDFDYLKEQRIVNSREAIRGAIERRSAQLPMHKRLLSYEVQAQPLPRTATRKLMRRLVKNECASHSLVGDHGREKQYDYSAGDDFLLDTESARQVLDVIKRESRVESTLHPGMNFELDLGFDSLRRIELIANIEQVLSIHLYDNGISQCFTIRDVLKQVAHQGHKGPPHLQGSAGTTRVTWKELLASASPGGMQQNYAVRPRPIVSFIDFLLLKLVLMVSKILFRLEVEGIENLPRQGPYLICPNHQGYLDGVLVTSAFPYSVVKDLFSLGWSPYYSTGLRRVLANMIKTLPIDPDSNLLPAMKTSSLGLKSGKILLMFPEGGMSIDGELQTFKKGAAILAQELGVPVVPVAIKGSFAVWSKVSKGLRLAPVKIKIGTPLTLDAPEQLAGDTDRGYARGANRIQSELRTLLETQ